MAQQPHDLTGKVCAFCKKEFTRRSISHSVTVRVKHFWLYLRSCTECHRKHKRGELGPGINEYVKSAGFEPWPESSE